MLAINSTMTEKKRFSEARIGNTSGASNQRSDGDYRTRRPRLPRPFWILWAGTIVLRIGFVVQPFLAFYLNDERGMSTTETGAVLGVIGVGGVLSQLAGGSLADRIGRRQTIVFSVFATGVATIALGYAQTTVAIIVLAFLVGLTVDMYRPASQAIIADVVAAPERAWAFGLLVWAVNVGFSTAMVLGGMLAVRGFVLLCWANALACIAFGLIVWCFMPETRMSPRTRKESDGFGAVFRDHTMVIFAFLMMIFAFVFMQAFSTLPLAMKADGVSSSTYGWIMAVNGIVIITCQPFGSRFIGRFDNHSVLAAGTLIVGVGYGLTAFSSSTSSYVACVIVWSLGEVVVVAVATSIVAELSPVHLRGRYNGVYGMVWAVGSLLAPLCGTQLLEHVGAAALWLICCGLCLSTAVGHLLLASAIRRRLECCSEPVTLLKAR